MKNSYIIKSVLLTLVGLFFSLQRTTFAASRSVSAWASFSFSSYFGYAQANSYAKKFPVRGILVTSFVVSVW